MFEFNLQLRYIYTLKHYLTIKTNEALIHATIWINPENFMLSENSQTPKTIYYMITVLFPFYEISRIYKSIETESRSMVARGLKRTE